MEKRTTEGYSNLHAGSRPPAPSSDFITRAPTQRQKLILFLRERGERGGTNTELIGLGLYRYSSRIHECRAAGYVLESARETEGRWCYFLRHEPAVESPPYVFQQLGPTEQDQPKVLVGVTTPLFASVPGER